MPNEGPLAIENLRVSYGKVEVVRRLSLKVARGEMVGLAGRNGAGKTTTLRAISGLLPRQGGRLVLDGIELPVSPAKVARKGVAHVPEGRGLLPSLSVIDNLRVAAFAAGGGISRADLDALIGIFPALAELLPRMAGGLSGGQQQIVAISRGLAAKPRILMIDELSLGLAPKITSELWSTLTRISALGDLGILVVDQNLRLMRRNCRRIYWLNDGISQELDVTGGNAEQHFESIYFD